MSKNNKLILIPVISLILIIIVASYAFFTSRSSIREQTIGAEAARVTLEYTDCGDNTQDDCANINASLKPGDSITKTFKVENTGTQSVEFSIVFKELENTFLNDELVYILEDITDNSKVVEEIPVPYADTLLTDELILEGVNVAVNETKEYRLTITFKEIDESQNYNADAMFSIKIGIGFIHSEDPIFAGLMRQPSQNGVRKSNDVLGKEISPTMFESIATVDSNEIPDDIPESQQWNVSGDGTDLVKAWYKDADGNGLYELYIGQEDGVVANPDSSNLFEGFTNVKEIDLGYYDTSNVTNMSNMFSNDNNLKSIYIFDSFRTNNVMNSANMFYGCSSLVGQNGTKYNSNYIDNTYARLDEEMEVVDTSNDVLPSNYEKVKYIESNGTQFINTGVAAKASLKVISDMKPVSAGYAFGVTPAQNYKYYGINISPWNHRMQAYLGTAEDYSIYYNIWKLNERFTIVANDNRKFYKNNTLIEDFNVAITTMEFDPSQPIYIFCLGGLYRDSGRISMQLYSFKMYDNDVLIRNFVPCYRKSDNMVGLYDTVNGAFYTNGDSNGDPFVMGTTDNKIYPSGYFSRSKKETLRNFQRVEYIESNGTQYIETRASGAEVYGLYFEFTPISMNENNVSYIATRDKDFKIAPRYNVVNYISANHNTSTVLSGTYLNNISKVTVNISNNKFKLNNNEYYINTNKSISSYPFNVFLFTNYTWNRPSSAARVYSLKMYDVNNNLIRDYIPAYRKSDHIAGLYDLANNIFYPNENPDGDNFTVGPAVN